MNGIGVAGRLARAFMDSKLTPVLVGASLLLGTFALVRLPREEEPQIRAPMFDVFVPFPGASAAEVERRVVQVGERKLWEIPGVEYLYTTSEPGFALFVVRFRVGFDSEEAMTRVTTKVFANLDVLASGAARPLIKPRSIDDVPIVALTLTGAGSAGAPIALRRAAALVRDEISAIPDVAETELIGGRRRQFRVRFDPAALSARRLTVLELARSLEASNIRLPAGHSLAGSSTTLVETDALIRTVEELAGTVVGVSGGRPVRLRDVARVSDGPDESEQEVRLGAAPAVTISVSKRPGANATALSEEIIARADSALSRSPGVAMSVTRNYGETAREKSDELLFHLGLATVSVTLLIALVLGMREGLVVLVAIPVTLGLTLLIYFLSGYTLNRITLFALIFSIGILVDDAIVVVENIHRRSVERPELALRKAAIEAVAEVGNPTILATLAVIAAIAPMAFVGGLMGPYMRPIPVGASAAMLFSLAVAFIVSPWAFTGLLRIWPRNGHAVREESRLDRLYRRGMGWLLGSGRRMALTFLAIAALLAAAVALVPLKAVAVKMLPFDDKNEFQVVLDMPEDSSLARTGEAAAEIAAYLQTLPEVRTTVRYVGTAAPYDFNGLVRHYFLRRSPYQAQVQVLLTGKRERRRKSHEVAREARGPVLEIARRWGARVQTVEAPPGPPVLSTIVLEVYGPDAVERDALAKALAGMLRRADGVVDVDSDVPDPRPKVRLTVDRVKASLNGIAPEAIARTVAASVGGLALGLAHVDHEPEPVEIRLRLGPGLRDRPGRVAMMSKNGTMVPISEVTREARETADPPRMRKNLLPVSYVLANAAGRRDSPVYALLNLRGEVERVGREQGINLKQYFTRLPPDSREWAVKWGGEWQITYEVFRDLGLAFALVLILIYVLIVYWFDSLTLPLVIMTPIPLTLVGILPAHWAMGAFFTATSMIGFIAGAGIVVRNSIILVDFIRLRLAQGMPLREAVVDAGAVRFRPMLLTAAAVMVGAGVILFDPIFQGLAISLIAGEVASTLLSRTSVPVLYYLWARWAGKEAV